MESLFVLILTLYWTFYSRKVKSTCHHFLYNCGCRTVCVCSHIARLNLSFGEHVAQKKLHLFKLFLSHVLIDFVQHHPERESRSVEEEKEERNNRHLTTTGINVGF